MTRRSEMAKRHLYLCTPDRDDLLEFVEACIAGGVDVVQLREKDASAKRIIERGRLLAEMCAGLDVPFLINDRPDLAIESGAAGVHVGQDDVPAELARRLLGDEAIVGLSTHAPDEVAASTLEPVDYISAGPVVATPTKPGRPGTGADYISLAVEQAGRPVFVTGGVSPETVPALAAAGARHFVVVRYLTESDDPKGAAKHLREAIDRALEEA
ncbi:MAG: thiamine phosphate synthase [Acidimicrobiales bacterium]